MNNRAKLTTNASELRPKKCYFLLLIIGASLTLVTMFAAFLIDTTAESPITLRVSSKYWLSMNVNWNQIAFILNSKRAEAEIRDEQKRQGTFNEDVLYHPLPVNEPTLVDFINSHVTGFFKGNADRTFYFRQSNPVQTLYYNNFATQIQFFSSAIFVNTFLVLGASLGILAMSFVPTLRVLFRKRRGQCILCRYDMKNTQSNICPECGFR